MDIAKTVSDLVQIDTTNNGKNTADERPVQDYLEPLFREIGLETQRVAFDSEKKRENLIGKLVGTGKGRDLILNSHTDVVPQGDPEKWVYPPFSGKIIDDKVHGRGTVDDKGQLACIYWAIKAIRECGVKLNGDVYCIASVGEESGEGRNYGLGPALDVNKYKDPFCMVVEASAMELAPVTSGLFDIDITIFGKPAHTCARGQMIYPQNINIPCGYEVGADALQKALPYIDFFYRYERQMALRFRDPLLSSGGREVPDKVGVGIFTCGPTNICGGAFSSSTIDKVSIHYKCFYPESVGFELVAREIKEGVNAITQTDEWTKKHPPELRLPDTFHWRGSYVDPDCEVIQKWKEVLDIVTDGHGVMSGCPGVTDATFAIDHGIPAAVCGMGNLGGNHQHGPNEWVDIKDLVVTAKMCARMIEWYCM